MSTTGKGAAEYGCLQKLVGTSDWMPLPAGVTRAQAERLAGESLLELRPEGRKTLVRLTPSGEGKAAELREAAARELRDKAEAQARKLAEAARKLAEAARKKAEREAEAERRKTERAARAARAAAAKAERAARPQAPQRVSATSALAALQERIDRIDQNVLRVLARLEGRPATPSPAPPAVLDLAKLKSSVLDTIVELDVTHRYHGLIPIPAIRDALRAQVPDADVTAALEALEKDFAIDLNIAQSPTTVDRRSDGIEREGRGLLYYVARRGL